MEILTNKDKILEEHRKHCDRVEGRETKEIKTYQATPDDLAEIKQILMVILSKVRGIDSYVRDPHGHIGRRASRTVAGEYSEGTDPNDKPETARLFVGETE